MSLLAVIWFLLGPAVPEAPVAEDPVTRVVVLVPEGGDARVDDVVATVRSNTSPDDVDIVTVEAAGPTTLGVQVVAAQDAAVQHDAPGVFWFDLRKPAEYVVYLYVRDRAVLRRRVPEAAESVEAAVETMWLIVRSGALAVAMGVDVEMEKVDLEAEVEATAAKPAADSPSTPPAPALRGVSEHQPPQRVGLWVSLAYLGGGLANTVAWQSGGSVEVSGEVHPLVKLGVGYSLLAGPLAPADDFRVLRHEVGPVLGVGGRVVDRLRLEGRLLPAAEVDQWRSGVDTSAGTRVVGKVAAELVFRIWLVPHLTLDLGAGAGVAFNAFDFVRCDERAAECTGSSRRVVLDPWRVRPRARAGLSAVF